MVDSDSKVNVAEINCWYQIVKKRWPEVPKEQAGNALKNFLYSLKSQNQVSRINIFCYYSLKSFFCQKIKFNQNVLEDSDKNVIYKK